MGNVLWLIVGLLVYIAYILTDVHRTLGKLNDAYSKRSMSFDPLFPAFSREEISLAFDKAVKASEEVERTGNEARVDGKLAKDLERLGRWSESQEFLRFYYDSVARMIEGNCKVLSGQKGIREVRDGYHGFVIDSAFSIGKETQEKVEQVKADREKNGSDSPGPANQF